ncbi:two-component system sensor histidine kinase EvgS [Silvimonas terrae]|uniref:Virulence sensor protein BvgS n=1 Tax=Silvimonas terrae TaxID=300266 RepID=A0A840RET6_9NEIS|nr:transporter substrate-binding domain-containing protein [Silvimonas terrae]MBB5191845.1 two-component system sensor histidine kinase EvgS [Silvimonas terrae]
MRQALALLVLLCLTSLHAVRALADTPEPGGVHLLGRSQLHGEVVNLDAADWQWLRHKQALVIGTNQPDYPPFDIAASGQDYEGITADYAGLLGQLLHTPIKVKRFATRQALIAALVSGQIDLLGTANHLEMVQGDVLVSSPYVENVPALVETGTSGQVARESGKGKRLAFSPDYVLPKDIQVAFPGAILVPYYSSTTALGAMATGQVDAMFSDAVTAQYLINRFYNNDVHISRVDDKPAGGFGFAVSHDNTRLLRIINSALAALGPDQQRAILDRWSGGGIMVGGVVALTAQERAWLAARPVVRVGLNDHLAPFSYMAEDGHFRGVTPDLLAALGLRTGIQFELHGYEATSEAVAALSRREVDVLADFTYSPDRRSSYGFTRPYLVMPLVMVTRDLPDSPTSLADLKGKTLIVPKGYVLAPIVRRDYPDIHLNENSSVLEAFERLQRGEADALIQPISTARYYILRRPDNGLKISAVLGDQPALVGFAVRQEDTELRAILDRALLSVSPDEMSILSNRWRTNEMMNAPSWKDYRGIIALSVAVAALLLLAFLLWNASLRKQVNRRLKAERELNDQLQFMEVLINGTPHPIYVRDHETRLVACNDYYLKALGTTREAAIGFVVLDCAALAPADAALLQAEYQSVIAGGEAVLGDRKLTINGALLTVYQWSLPFTNFEGETGMIGGWIDISEREQLVEELQAAKVEADEANKAKTTFLATMSHEIRTPMNAILGMLELALKRADKGVLDRPSVEVAHTSAQGLLELIGDILDIARIESGKLTLNPERANLRDLAASAARVFDGLARQKGLQLVLDVDRHLDGDVLIDPLRFKQILSNLVSNAIKFTAEGSVTIRLQGQPLEGDRLHIHMQVEDTGMGISEQDQQRLFQPFAQVRSTANGTGLGLVICRTLAKKMGGSLTLQSAPGKGSTVTVDLDLACLAAERVERAPLADANNQPMPVLKVLVADDQPANRMLITQQLEFLGHEVVAAVNGAEAFEQWRKGHFDLVITDANMPVMNGYELARRIRTDEAERNAPRCPVWSLTANALPDEYRRSEAAGMDICLFKPVTLAVLEHHLRATGPQQITTPAVPPAESAFDTAALGVLTGGNPGMMTKLLTELINSSEDDLRQLQTLLAAPDPAALSEHAHRVKGVARIVQARQVLSACEQLEAVCKNPQNGTLAHAGQQLVAAMQGFLAALRQVAADAGPA